MGERHALGVPVRSGRPWHGREARERSHGSAQLRVARTVSRPGHAVCEALWQRERAQGCPAGVSTQKVKQEVGLRVTPRDVDETRNPTGDHESSLASARVLELLSRGLSAGFAFRARIARSARRHSAARRSAAGCATLAAEV